MLNRNPATPEASMRVMSALVATALTGIATAQPLPDPQIDYWTVPCANSRPRDPDLDRNGIVWFVGPTGDYVASYDPKTNNSRRPIWTKAALAGRKIDVVKMAVAESRSAFPA
jgi:streptogramin lyase